MAIITISREYGSEGTNIGRRLSGSLNYLYVDKKLIEKVLDKYGLVTFNEMLEEKHSFWERYDYNNDQVISMLSKTMLAFSALDNCVILGRGGFTVLGDYQNTVNVLVEAPFEKRIENIIKRNEAKDIRSAEKLIIEKDKQRDSFLKVFYDVDGNNSDFFDLVINTSKLSVETACKWVSEAAAEIDSADIDLSNSTLGIDVNRILAETIKEVIKY